MLLLSANCGLYATQQGGAACKDALANFKLIVLRVGNGWCSVYLKGFSKPYYWNQVSQVRAPRAAHLPPQPFPQHHAEPPVIGSS